MLDKKLDIFCSASEKEITNIERLLIPSLLAQDIDIVINLWIINYTGKNSIWNSKDFKSKNIIINELRPDHDVGFGEAHNFAFKKINPEKFFMIINPDVYLHKSCIKSFIERFNSEKGIGILEGRQLPFEHPKEYDRDTNYTPWASGACMFLSSEFFRKVNGFDEKFWMYTEDVDLSWRAWINDYKVILNPDSVVYHFTGAYFSYHKYRYYIEHLWSAINFFYINYKYFGDVGFRNAKKYFNKLEIYDKNLKNKVIEEFEKKKKDGFYKIENIESNKIDKLKRYIKVLGFNKFHKLQSESNGDI